MLTEAEARTKWCPFVRREGDYLSRQPVNRPVDNNSRCLASECMAWRVGKVTTHQTGMNKAVRDGRETRLVPATEEVSHGYCGLAGEPWPPLLKVETGAAS